MLVVIKQRLIVATRRLRLAVLEERFQQDFELSLPFLNKKTTLLSKDYFDAVMEILQVEGIRSGDDLSHEDLQHNIGLLADYAGRVPKPAFKTLLELMSRFYQNQIDSIVEEKGLPEQATYQAFEYEDYKSSLEKIQVQFATVGRLPIVYVQKIKELFNTYEALGLSQTDREYLEALEVAARSGVRRVDPAKLPTVADQVVEGIKREFREYKKRQAGQDSFVEEMKTLSEVESSHEQREQDRKALDTLMRFFVHRAFKTPEIVKAMQDLLNTVPVENRQSFLSECNRIAGLLRKGVEGTQPEQLLSVYHKHVKTASVSKLKTVISNLRILI